MTNLSLFDAVILAFAALLVASAVMYDTRRRLRVQRRAQRTCADAVEGAGLKLEPDTYCDYAFSILHAMGAFALPVMVGDRFLGFFALTDALKCSGRDFASTYVGTVMITADECGYVRADSNLEQARRQLRSSPYMMLPVLDRNKKLLGFVTEDSINRVARPALARV